MKMNTKNVHFYHIMLYYFKRSWGSSKICSVYKNGDSRTCVSKVTYQIPFCDFNINDAPHHDITFPMPDQYFIERSQTVQKIATTLNILILAWKTISANWDMFPVNVWVLHKLIEVNLINHIYIWDSLLKCQKNEPFSKRMVMGNEK